MKNPETDDNVSSIIRAYSHKTVELKYRGVDFHFALSHGLFSSNDIDSGSRLLLKVFSRSIDVMKDGGFAPRSLLDAGSGVGVLGVCAAKALESADDSIKLKVEAEDRDELARVFTEYNALTAGLRPESFGAFARPLLSGVAPEGGWDIILSNVPAKAGLGVLEDFVRRSSLLLSPDGRAFIVVVAPLADQFRAWIAEYAAPLEEEKGPGHTVFVYQKKVSGIRDQGSGANPYLRRSAEYKVAGTTYKLATYHGAAGFDSPGGAVEAAARLTVKFEDFITVHLAKHTIGSEINTPPLLFWETGQGHFPVWFNERYLFSRKKYEPGEQLFVPHIVVSGRNAIANDAAVRNIKIPALYTANGCWAKSREAADLALDAGALLEAAGGPYTLVTAFPEAVPKTDRIPSYWDALGKLTQPGGIALFSLHSSEAERFDKLKPKGWRRIGGIKREGFRALVYIKGK